MTGSSALIDGDDVSGASGGGGKDVCSGDAVCEGCCELIFSRFVMKVGNTSWHEECLFCSECHASLTSSCFYKDGRLFCRNDYERRYGVKCGRCGQCIWPNEMVMRTRHYIYHLFCFICTVCGRSLSTGEQYVIRAGQVVCMDDYEKEFYMVQGFAAASGSVPGPPGSLLSGPPSSEFVQDGQQGLADDFVVETSGRHQRDGRRGPKRPRTILTAAQRRQFKASFEVSPKPCRKVREALAKETGLSVRVVQVWFQNQRAKMKKMQRRGKVDKDGKKTKDGEKSKSSDGKESFEGGDSSVHSRDDFIDSDDADDDDEDDMSTYGGHLDGLDGPDRNQILESGKSGLHVVGPSQNSGPIGLASGILGAHSQLPLSSDSMHLTSNPIDKLYLMQDSYFTHM